MSVLACDRAGCDNVMCDRFSDDYGYICWECFNELTELGTLDIQEFMYTPRPTIHNPDPETYEKIFPKMEGCN
jgi:hypothetical protein